eukprot:1440059-Prymnesium_polylepis.1
MVARHVRTRPCIYTRRRENSEGLCVRPLYQEAHRCAAPWIAGQLRGGLKQGILLGQDDDVWRDVLWRTGHGLDRTMPQGRPV